MQFYELKKGTVWQYILDKKNSESVLHKLDLDPKRQFRLHPGLEEINQNK